MGRHCHAAGAPALRAPAAAGHVLGPTGNSRDFAYIDELGMLEFGSALHEPREPPPS